MLSRCSQRRALGHGSLVTTAFLRHVYRGCTIKHSAAANCRSIHSRGSISPQTPYTSEQGAILSAALNHVPQHGFTDAALLMGLKDAGYLDITTNIFPQGPFEIAKYHMIVQRERLANYTKSEKWKALSTSSPRFGVTNKIRELCVERLSQNKELIHRWPEAIALMKIPTNLQSSAAELFGLADTMWEIAGDTTVDASWYTKRGILSGIYASTEVYMTKDNSPEFQSTWQFLDQRLENSRSIGSTAGRIGQYLDYAQHNVVNVLRSKGLKF